MLNRVTLVGRITKDPELRTSVSGKKFVGFTLAVNNSFRKNNNAANSTAFISCFAWERQAENLATYVKKGMLLAVDGSLVTTKRDGVYSTFVNARTISFLERSKNTTPNFATNPVNNLIPNELDDNGTNKNLPEPTPDDASILFDDEDIL